MAINRFLLEMFTVVVEAKRITTAAKLLNLTQSAVSKEIKRIESYLGVALLTRGLQGVEPTTSGQIVYRHAKQILAQFDCMEREIDDLTRAEEREVVVGASPTVGNFALPCSLWSFKERFPKAEIHLEVGGCADMAERVLARSVAMAIIEGPVPANVATAPGIKWRCISGDYLVLVAPTQGSATQERLTLEGLRAAPLVLPGRNVGIREIFERSVEELGIPPRELKVMSQIGGLEAMKSILEARGGIMLATRLSVQKELKQGAYLDVTPMGLEMKVPFHLICFEDTLPPVARRFIRFIAAPEELASCWA